MRYFVVVILVFSQFAFLKKTSSEPIFDSRPKEKIWVDSVYNQMTLDEKIAQLFVIAAYSNKDSAHIKSIEKLITDYNVGGIIFFQGGPYRQVDMTNRFQSKSKLPLFISIDAEWGLGMRLDSTHRYPWNMTLGAVQDMKLIEELGMHMGKESKRIGVHYNFSPVVDINTDPNNPIIGNRSFGEDKENVTERALAIVKGIQSQDVFATAKHFPGHGATATDSHYELPVLRDSKDKIEAFELYPYKKLIEEDLLSSVIVGHLSVPSFDSSPNLPATLSYNIVTKLLKEELGFKGLVITDALNMKGATASRKPVDVYLEAFLAGNDLLVLIENVPLSLEKFKEAYQDAIFDEERLAHSVKKILKYKYRIGLDNYVPVEEKDISKDLNTIENTALDYRLYENAITVLKNEDNILPIKDFQKQKIAYVKLGDDLETNFLASLKNYTNVTEIVGGNQDELLNQLKGFTTVIIGYHKSNANPWKNHTIKSEDIEKIYQIAKNYPVILDVFAKPYSLLALKEHKNIKGLIVSYQNNEISQNVSAQLIFGAIASKGKLPVTVNDFPVNSGLNIPSIERLGFTIPENVGMSSKILAKIDSVAVSTISKKITPGMQIVVARAGKVIYQKSFGNHTFDDDLEVQNTDIYDVASLTKILSTLPNVMLSVDQKKLSLDTKLGDMLPLFKTSNKKTIDLKELLSHNAGLQSSIPFYKATLDQHKQPSKIYYRNTYTSDFPFQVAENLFIRKDYPEIMLKIIADSKLGRAGVYKYSDLPFIILKDYLEKEYKKTLDELSQENFYRSIGANHTLYNPLRKFDMSEIPPTEKDKYFRYQVVQGYVHDMAAAMEGGIGGHAGLFSNALDVAKMMQMYLQEGSYGGKQYFSQETFRKFNSVYFYKQGNRRALGFDKPEKKGGGPGPTCDCVSIESFGHSGFTGTFAWVDPETEIVYVFLSNRTFPSAETNLLAKENIRTIIHQIINDAIIN